MVEKTSYLINQKQFIDFYSPLLHYIQLKTFDYVSYPVEYILFPGGIYAYTFDTARLPDWLQSTHALIMEGTYLLFQMIHSIISTSFQRRFCNLNEL